MSLIPLGQVFQAIVWFVEKQADLPEENIIGFWDASDKHLLAQWPQYYDLVKKLGYDYFRNSSYKSTDSDIDLSNFIDDGLILKSTNEINAVKSDDTSYFGTEMDNLLMDLVDKHLNEFIHSENQNDDEDFVVSMKPEMPKAEVLTTKKKDRERKFSVENQQQNQISATQESTIVTRFAHAHKILLNALSKGVFTAHGNYRMAQRASDISDTVKSSEIIQPIPTTFWQQKWLPHYEHNAVQFGTAHKMVFNEIAVKHNCPNGNKLSAGDKYWLCHVKIEAESFYDNYLPLISPYFETPEEASFIFDGKNFIINFGKDKSVKVKEKDGLHTLRILIFQTNTARDSEDGIGVELLDAWTQKILQGTSLTQYLINAFEQMKEEKQEYEDEAEKYADTSASDGLAVRIKILRDNLRKYIKAHWAIKHDQTIKLERKRVEIENTLKAYNNLEKSKIDIESIEKLLKMRRKGKKREDFLKEVVPSRSEYETEDAIDKESLQNGLWNRIKPALKGLKYDCPHFYHHMFGGERALKQRKGYKMAYQPQSKIKWDLGLKIK